MKPKLIIFCHVLSVLINIAVGVGIIFIIRSNPVFTGNYKTEDINLFARIQRADFLSEVLRKQFEIDGGKNLPTVISKLAQNSNPQLWLSGEYVLLKMDSQSFIILTREETEAVIAHELAHLILGHSFGGVNDELNMEQEIEADRYAVRYIKREYLNSALKKLSRNEEELEKRLNAIGS